MTSRDLVVVGLGVAVGSGETVPDSERRHRRDRRNVGRLCVEHIGEEWGLAFMPEETSGAWVASTVLHVDDGSVNVHLVVPGRKLMESGRTVRRVLRALNCVPEDLLVVFPDLYGCLGKYRFHATRGRSSSVRPGMDDLWSALKCNHIPSIGVGINGIHKPEKLSEWTAFMSQRMTQREQRMLERRTMVRMVDAVTLYVRGELDPLPDYNVVWGNGEQYVCGKKIGEGKFGSVFEALDTRKNRKVVLKMLKKTRDLERKIAREVRMLMAVRGSPNIVQLFETAIIEDEEYRDEAMVFEYVHSLSYKEIFPNMNLETAKIYMHKLLEAVADTHARGIVHLDIKPSNVLFHPDTLEFRLADWGLAAFWRPGVPNHGPLGTRCYKAPELCLRYDLYGPPVDIWAVGCTLGAILFLPDNGHTPFIRARGTWLNQLIAITSFVGSDILFAYMEKYNMDIHLTDDEIAALQGFPPVIWGELVTAKNEHMVDQAGWDLLGKLLACDHADRLTAAEALQHPFFDDIRTHPAILATTSATPAAGSTATTTTTSSSRSQRRGRAKSQRRTKNY